MKRTTTPQRGPSPNPTARTLRNRILRAWRKYGAGLSLRTFAGDLTREDTELGAAARGWLARKEAR